MYKRQDQKAYKAIISELTPQCIIRFGATFPMTTIGKGKKKTTVRAYEHPVSYTHLMKNNPKIQLQK